MSRLKDLYEKKLKELLKKELKYENDFHKRSITITTNQKNIINEF